MKILLINPNTTESMTEEMVEAARAAASPGTEIVGSTAATGVPAIDGYHDDLLGAAAVSAAISTAGSDYDSAVIACFGDPGLYAAREITDFPVIGIAEASFLVASTVGYRFGIITNLERGVPLLVDLVDHHGFAERCAGIVATEISVLDADRDRDAAYVAFEAAAERSLTEDRADVLLLACGALLGIKERLEATLGVPVIEGVPAGIAIAEAVVRLRLRTSKLRAFKRPESPRLDVHSR